MGLKTETLSESLYEEVPTSPKPWQRFYSRKFYSRKGNFDQRGSRARDTKYGRGLLGRHLIMREVETVF